ncbi:MAG: aldo/keto reductase [Deinococcota bacterium]
MNYNVLGNTGLLVSELCLGTMTFGGTEGMWALIGAQQQAEASAIVERALQGGINFIDTANVYAQGESEKLLGQALKDVQVPRHKVVLSSKVLGRVGDGPNDKGLSRVHIQTQIEQTLNNLQTDYLDVYIIHGFDPLTPLEATLRALDEVVKQGKVRYLAASNLAAWQLTKALWVSDKLGLERFEALQAYYTVAGRDLEREVVPLLRDQNVGLMVWSPLAGGFLSGKYDRNTQKAGDSRRDDFDFPPIDRQRAYDVIDVMKEIATQKSVSVAQVALAWLLQQEVVSTVIIGAKRMEQLEDNLAATRLELSEPDLSKLAEVSALPPEYPGWMLERQGAGRDLDRINAEAAPPLS